MRVRLNYAKQWHPVMSEKCRRAFSVAGTADDASLDSDTLAGDD